jgi:diguanylate cyclase (GGDEF)-like protein/PAS domain S-box-containing protein
MVEDEAAHAELVRRALASHLGRFHVTVAGSLAQARAFLAEFQPHLIIVDLLLPDGRGTELFPAEGERRAYPLVVMTSHGDEHVAVEAMKAGALDYVVKSPETLADMPRVVEQALREWRHIVERTRAETALRESEARYRALYDDNPSMYFTLDGEGLIAAVNRFGAEQLGYTPEELIGQSVLKVFHPDDREAVQRQLAECLREIGQIARWEFRKIRKDGSILWVKEDARAVRDADGRPIVLVVCEDITTRKQAETALRQAHADLERRVEERTAALSQAIADLTREIAERRQAEDALREAEARYRGLFEGVPLGLYRTTPAGQILDANPAIVQMMGYPDRETYLKIGAADLYVDPEDRTAWQALMEREGVVRDFEAQARRRDGTIIWVRDSARAVRDAAGQVLCYEGYWEDITERKQAEAALREAEAKYRTLVEQMPAVTYINAVERFSPALYVSPQVEALLGYTPEEWLADAGLWPRLLHPDDRERVRAEDEQTNAAGAPFRMEYRMLAREGRLVWVRDEAVLVRDGAGRPQCWQGVLLDITERKLTEEALQSANEKLMRGLTELEQRTREIKLLNQMGDLLQACLTAEEAYAVIGQSARELFPDEAGAVYMISASRNIVEAVTMWGRSPAGAAENTFAPEECWALRRGRPHVVETTSTGLLCRHLSDPPPAAYLCLPMMAQSEAIGVLYLQSAGDATGAGLTPAKQQLAQTAADGVALALSNLRLRETLRHQSIRDPLTGLFNRRYMEETLERETRRVARARRSLGIIMLDVDHFKQFNDTFGHDAGDVLLRELGGFLRAHIRGEDVACRYGGEEFTLILPEASLEVTCQRAEHLREGVKHMHALYYDQPLGSIALSLGVAVYPQHGATAEAVLKAADAALYRAKREGRDQVAVAGAVASDLSAAARE